MKAKKMPTSQRNQDNPGPGLQDRDVRIFLQALIQVLRERAELVGVLSRHSLVLVDDALPLEDRSLGPGNICLCPAPAAFGFGCVIQKVGHQVSRHKLIGGLDVARGRFAQGGRDLFGERKLERVQVPDRVCLHQTLSFSFQDGDPAAILPDNFGLSRQNPRTVASGKKVLGGLPKLAEAFASARREE